MNKRIRWVYALSLLTLLLIIGGQVYWLLGRYQLSGDECAAQLETDCTRLLRQETAAREAAQMGENGESKKQIKIGILMNMQHGEMPQLRTTDTKLSFYINEEDTPVVINKPHLRSEDGLEIEQRYYAGRAGAFSRQAFDSLLIASGYAPTTEFLRCKSEDFEMEPQYFRLKKLGQDRIRVVWSVDPLRHDEVRFTLSVPANKVVQRMMWQLLGSLLLMVVLAVCLFYQLKTISLLRQIDRLRREHILHLQHEMKQLPQEEPSDGDAIRLGDTLFFYPTNELRSGDRTVVLTSRQAELLFLLAQKRNTLVMRDELLSHIWGDNSYQNSLALNVQVSYLRRALALEPRVSIEVVVRKGYVLRVK